MALVPDAAARRRAAAHVFVADIDHPELGDEDAHHLARVLRLRPGQTLSVADGVGGWRLCSWTGGGAAGLEASSEVYTEGAPAPAVTVAFAPTKGDRPEWAVTKLTELGVDRIVALAAERAVVRWDQERASRHLQRWTELARQAAMQCRRVRLPAIDGPATVAELVGAGVALAVPGGSAPSLERPTVLVGPEGGWSREEGAAGVATLGLGPNVLRTETAAVAAGTLGVALRAGLVAPA